MSLGYIDAASGSMLLQLIVGGVAAMGLALKMWWRSFPPFPAHPQARRRRIVRAGNGAAAESVTPDPVREPVGKH